MKKVLKKVLAPATIVPAIEMIVSRCNTKEESSEMANQPDVEKRLIGIRISIETYYKLLRLAGGNRNEVHNVIRKILAAQVDGIELTEEEREEILAEIRRNKEKQRRSI